MTNFIQNQNRLIISEKIYTNPDPYVTLTYLVIQKVTKHNLHQDFVFYPDIICYHIYGNMTQNVDKIAAACKMLAAQRFIGRGPKDYYITNFDNFYNLPTPFTFIYEDELSTIIKSGKHNMPGVLQYFVSMVATINLTYGWGYTTGKTFAERLGTSTNTIYAYDKFLKENKLISFVRRESKNYLYKRKKDYVIKEDKKGEPDTPDLNDRHEECDDYQFTEDPDSDDLFG